MSWTHFQNNKEHCTTGNIETPGKVEERMTKEHFLRELEKKTRKMEKLFRYILKKGDLSKLTIIRENLIG